MTCSTILSFLLSSPLSLLNLLEVCLIYPFLPLSLRTARLPFCFSCYSTSPKRLPFDSFLAYKQTKEERYTWRARRKESLIPICLLLVSGEFRLMTFCCWVLNARKKDCVLQRITNFGQKKLLLLIWGLFDKWTLKVWLR